MCFPGNSVKCLRKPLGDCCYLQKELSIAYVMEGPLNMVVKIFAFIVSIIFLQSALTKKAINYFFHTQVNSGCSNIKVQNTFLTKFKIMKLKIDACSMFMTFLSAVPKNLWMDFFVEYPVDKPFSTGV